MYKISDRPDVHILCEVKCPSCGNARKPFETKVVEVIYDSGVDGSTSGWAIITNCCNAVLVKSHTFDMVVNLLNITNDRSGKSDDLHIKKIIPPLVPIEILEINSHVP